MCGIAGLFDLEDRRPISSDLLHEMNQRQFHRGPDAGEIFQEAGIGLAHRRLAIIDRAGGHQPLADISQSAVIVFNGEIYNYKALREQLQSLDFKFKTNSDTEVILNAWLAWGEDCVNKLRGMFAFAIWDKTKQSLFLARDRLGIKPLFYCFTSDGYVAFASELKAVRFINNIDLTLNHQAVADYFTLGYIPEPKTIYEGVHKLCPGQTLYCNKQSPATLHTYWDVPLLAPNELAQDNQEALVNHLNEAVGIRMISEVPLGAFLSGGVDSSSVVATMSKLQNDPVQTCSIGFDSKEHNESHYAKLVADKLKTKHYCQKVASDDFDLVDKLSYIYDEPFADSSALPTFRVCQLARQRVTVALSGDGSDEIFAGYRRYRWHMLEEKIRRAIPHTARKYFFSPLAHYYPKADWAPKFLRAKSTLQALTYNSLEAYFNTVSNSTYHERDLLFSEAFKQSLSGYCSMSVFEAHHSKCKHSDPLTAIQYIDLKTYLVGDILTKVDRASMANSLEVRVPFLDHHLVEWAFGLPTSAKLQGKNGKHILKKAFENKLPNEILYRQKQGFIVPINQWMRGPLSNKIHDIFEQSGIMSSGMFNKKTISNLIKQHQCGIRDNSTMLWSLLMFAGFSNQSKAHRG